MCDLYSWVELSRKYRDECKEDKGIHLPKVLFLCDGDKEKLNWDALLGHQAICTKYDISVYSRRNHSHKESFTHVPRVIAEAVNAGLMEQMYMHDASLEAVRYCYPDWRPHFDKDNFITLPSKEENIGPKNNKEASERLCALFKARYEDNKEIIEKKYKGEKPIDEEFDSLFNKIKNDSSLYDYTCSNFLVELFYNVSDLYSEDKYYKEINVLKSIKRKPSLDPLFRVRMELEREQEQHRSKLIHRREHDKERRTREAWKSGHVIE